MVEKKSVEEWPPVVGDYTTGDVESAVAVVTLGSHMENTPGRCRGKYFRAFTHRKPGN